MNKENNNQMSALSFAEYLWLDGTQANPQIRSKSRVLRLPENPELSNFTVEYFDGAQTGQATECDNECRLKPARIYQDPLRGDSHYIVLCEVQDSGGNTHASNHRALLRAAIHTAGHDIAPQLGFKQTYLLSQNKGAEHHSKIGRAPKGTSHYGVGCENVFARNIAEAHANLCLAAGVLISDINAGGAPGQWEFRIGYRGIEGEACDALTIADDVWLARYLLHRAGEQFGTQVLFNTPAANEDRDRQRMCTTFSTAFTRDPRCGTTAITALVNTLESSYMQHRDNQCTGNWEQVSSEPKVRNINASKNTQAHCSGAIHVPSHVTQRGYGYIEDHRPAPDADPYQIGIKLVRAVSD